MTFIDVLRTIIRSPAFKFFLIGGLLLALGIPLALVWLLVSEREHRAESARSEVAQLWGNEQRITGPYLIVPYTVKIPKIDRKAPQRYETRHAVFLPETYVVNGETVSEARSRSIFETTLYKAKLRLEGRFAAPDVSLVDAEVAAVRWRDATIALSMSDVRGLKESVTLMINGEKRQPFEPGVGSLQNSMSGINARLFSTDIKKDQPLSAFTFAAELKFQGSSRLTFTPVGRETMVQLKSDWPHPSFSGAFLPDTRNIGANGFDANWRIPHLARSVSQMWRVHGNDDQLSQVFNYSFGVNFFVPVDHYSLVDRAAKYGLMFLAVAFMAVFLMELTSGQRVHPVQYVFVGLSMILFYVLLLSLAEHVGFTYAYIAASTATGGMLSAYVGKALCSTRKGLIMMSVFLILYGLLYLILRLEDYALLAGAVASFVMLTVVMFATLKVNWSGASVSPNTGQQAG